MDRVDYDTFAFTTEAALWAQIEKELNAKVCWHLWIHYIYSKTRYGIETEGNVRDWEEGRGFF